MPRNRRETTAKQRPSGNTVTAQAKPYIERIETLEAEKKRITDEITEEVAEVYDQAEREIQVGRKPLKHVVKLRKQERDNAAAVEKMNDDERSQYDVLANVFVDVNPALSSMLRTMSDNGATVTVTTATSELKAQLDDDEERLQAEERLEQEERIRRMGQGTPPADEIDRAFS